MEKLLLCAPHDDPERIHRLHALEIEVIFCDRLRLDSDQAFIEQVRGHDYVISGPGRWNAKVFMALQGSLKMAVKFGVGLDNFDLAAATRAGIAVANAPGSNAAAVAEHAVALILAVLRRISQADRQVRQGAWQMQCDSLIGKTVGLFGFGQIARKVATFLCGFPVTLLACDLNWPDTDTLPQVQRVELAELLEKSDVISLHIPLNQDTSAIVDARFLARMKKGACLINTARGGLVSEADLVEALQSGQLGGAGLDTFAAEPLPQSSPLLRLDNVVLTPHCASNTEQAFRQILGCCLDNVIAFRSGQGEAHIQNPDYARFLT